MRFLLAFIITVLHLISVGNVQIIEERADEFKVDESSIDLEHSIRSNGRYTIDNLPNPKSQGQNYFVSNPDQILTVSTVQELDAIAEDIEHSTQVEYVIVVVDDYVGDNDFEFAHSLFTKWGIGKRESNNGLLLKKGMNTALFLVMELKVYCRMLC